MYFNIGIHRHPKPEKKHLLIASMKRFEEAMRKHNGCREVYQLEDENSGALVGLAIWDSKDDFLVARPHIFKAIENDPFDEWEDSEPEGFRLVRV